jgi:hypothetical protein
LILYWDNAMRENTHRAVTQTGEALCKRTRPEFLSVVSANPMREA